MLFGVRKRAYLKGVKMTGGDSVLPMIWTLDLKNKWFVRYLVRLDRIVRGLKPFRQPEKIKKPWDKDWYQEWCLLKRKGKK